MVRTPCCKAEGLKKGAWTPEEDRKLIAYINEHGEGGWRTLPEKADLQRCGKSCRLRWANYLRPDIKRGEFSADEEETIIKLHAIHGNKWSAIARRLPGRTDNEIKNYWNTHIKKRLIKKGIDPVTHKPISEKSDRETKNREAEKDGPETSAKSSRGDSESETKKSPSLGSARLLNRVANRFARRVNQSVLTEIIEGGGGGGGPRSNNSSYSDSDCENAVSTTSTSKLLNKMVNTTTSTLQSNFDGNDLPSLQDGPSSASASSSTFSDSSASFNDPLMYCLDTPTTDDLHGITSENKNTDTDFFKFLNNMSNGEDFMDDIGVENTGFMKELASILRDDQLPYECDIAVPFEVNEGDACTSEGGSCGRAFEEMENYLDQYMHLEN